MRRLPLLVIACSVLTSSVFAGEMTLTPKMKIKLKPHVAAISKWVQDPVILEAVRAQNAENLALDEIKARDAEWIAAKGKGDTSDPLMERVLNHPAGAWLREKNEDAAGQYPESFLCDSQGANVAVSTLTSDYWQGDEAKWQNSFDEGRGKIILGTPEHDESSDTVLVQVSVPVMDGDQAIGVLVVGVRLYSLM